MNEEEEIKARSAAMRAAWDRKDTAARFAITSDRGRTDAANAWRFVDKFENRILYIPKWKKWLAWDGRRWLDDGGVGVYQLGKQFSDGLWSEFAQAARAELTRDELNAIRSFVKRSNQRGKIADFIGLAQSDERVVCQHENLNKDPYLLNCANGTLNLKTGELSKHNPNDLITQVAEVNYSPEATCPEWMAALNLIFDGDVGLVLYLQQLLGYCLSGLVSEHVLPIAYGNGCNGKSTITNVVLGLLGDYGAIANQELLMPAKHSGHPTEKAALYQKRFVAISEPAQGRRLDESKTKELTGGDMVSCRRMNEDFWNYSPTHTFWLSTNHKPKIGGVDEGIWRRVKLIPFTVDLRTKTEPRKGFAEWLIANEGPGILAWAVRGFRDWLEFGFAEPPAVTQATDSYRAGEDELGQWLGEFCIVEDGAEERADRLFECYSKNGGRLSRTAFGERLGQRFEKRVPTAGEHRRRVVYYGLRMADSACVE